MTNNKVVFDDSWISKAKNESKEGSWARAVMDTFEQSGKTYLGIISGWYDSYPHDSKEKKELKSKLESYSDVDHLGGVNELTWFEFIKHFSWQVTPVSEKVRHPDFYISHPFELFCEVSTLNKTNNEQTKLGGHIDHSSASSRIIRKAIDEKLDQLRYAEDKMKPAILVVFDYSSWSGYGTHRFQAIADYLLELAYLPSELSAFLYVDKGVNNEGKIVINGEQSAVYHNRSAKYPIPSTLFDIFPQFFLEIREDKNVHNYHSTWILG